MSVPGFRITLHNSLVTPILVGGAPRSFAILNGTIGAALVMGLRAWYLFPIFILLHVVAVLMAKLDPYFFEVLLRYLRQKTHFQV